MLIKFGYFATEVSLASKQLCIYPLNSEPTEEINLALSGDGWIFSPHPRHRLFSLPLNYALEGNFKSDDHAKYTLWVLSFIYGVKLASNEAEFLDATNIKPNHSFGFIFTNDDDIKHILDNAFNSFVHNDPLDITRTCAVIHLLFLSQTKGYLQFEKFSYLYMAFDSCYSILKNKKYIKHKNGIGKMLNASESLSIPYPKDFSEANKIRNDFFHEGLYLQKPIGYAVSANNLLFFENFICKLLFKILDIKCSTFTNSIPCECRDYIGIRLEESHQ